MPNAADLIQHMNNQLGAGTVTRVSRFVRSADAISFYDALGGDNFTIDPGEGYIVKLTTDADFRIVGSHDPSVVLALEGPQGGSTGTNLISLPYHAVPGNAEELVADIQAQSGDTVTLVSRWIATAGASEFYLTGVGGANFPIVRGEAYSVQVNTDVNYIPTHY